MSLEISQVEDVFSEAKKFLEFLSYSFAPAVRQLNERNRSFQITDDLSIGDIYSEVDIYSKNLKDISPEEFKEFVGRLNSIFDTSYSIHEFIESTQAECIAWDCPQFEYDNELNIIGEIDDPTYKLFVKFSDLYLQKIDWLVDEILRNNFEKHWNLLFELKSLQEIEKFLETRETLMPDQRRICSHYYDIINRVRRNFFDVNFAGAWPEDSSNNGDYWQTRSLKGEVLGRYESETETPLHGFRKILIDKISYFHSKFTILETREPFMNGLKKIKADVNSREFLLFIENNFHFDDSTHTTKIQEHDQPKIKASSFAVFLRTYMEGNKIRGATKRDLILWMAYEFYGVKGFKYDNLKGYLERKFLSSEAKESGNSIVKSFQRKNSAS